MSARKTPLMSSRSPSVTSVAGLAVAPARLKVINDPIHGHIEIPLYCISFIDTPEFQRLRSLKQLGTTCYVYPGARHSRFEHSLGVAHLANVLVKRLQYLQPELGISDREVELVTLSGLCHDLGHGPFSHAFELWINKQQGVSWHHEESSELLVERIIEQQQLNYSSNEIQMIKALIRGNYEGKQDHADRRFLFEIVANKRNGIDVDKFDYLARDGYFTGVRQYDFARLLLSCRVIDNQLCFHMKESYNLYALFGARYSMFKQVYTHECGLAVEAMVLDIFTLADPYLKISERAQLVEKFIFLNDTLLNVIESSEAPELLEARSLLDRLRRRKLYKHVGVVHHDGVKVDVTVADLMAHLKPGSKLEAKHLSIQTVRLNYGLKDQDPVGCVRFFREWTDNESFVIERDQISYLLPSNFSETKIHLVCKVAEFFQEASDAWHSFWKANDDVPSMGRSLSVPPSPFSPKPPDKRSPKRPIGSGLPKRLADEWSPPPKKQNVEK